MKLTIKILGRGLIVFATFSALVSFSRLILNIYFNTKDTDEAILLKLLQFIEGHALLTIILVIISINIVHFFIKIYKRFSNWFNNNNLVAKTISKYESYYNLGEYDKVLSAIKSKSIFKYSKKYNYSINRFAALIYLIEGKQKECFKSIKNALKFVKTDEMNNGLLKIKLQLFISAGSINSACEILKSIKNNQINSSSQTLTHFEALIMEKQGNLEEARGKLISASTLIENQNPKELFTIYNNLGRIFALFDNDSDEIRYYEKAKELISIKPVKYECHVIYQNLVGSYLLSGNYEKSASLLNEYFSMINKENKHDLLEYYNYLLGYYRQTNNFAGFISTINLMHKNLYPLLTKKEKLSSNIHELKICFNNIGIHLDLLHKIENDFTLYEDFNLHERLIAYQIIFQAITSEDGTKTLRTFKDMHNYIFNYFRNSFSEIDDYIKNEIDDFQIETKCSLLKEKVRLMDFLHIEPIDVFSLIQKKLKLLEEIADTYQASGNIIWALKSRLDYVDECMGSLLNPLTAEQIHSLKGQMLISFDKVESEIQPFIKHPEMPPALIRLAKYSSFFDKKDLAKKYRDKFLEFNLSVNHFAAFIQNYYNDVNNYLEN